MSLLRKQKEDHLFPSFTSMFDDFFGRDYFKGISMGTSIPAVNVTEEKDQFKIDLAVPGMKKSDFKIDLDHNVLTISSEKKEEKEEKKEGHFMRREYSFHSFSRSFTLPENVDADKISASYDDGELRIVVPKKEGSVSSAKQIDIK